MEPTTTSLTKLAAQVLPRLLSQVDRDPNSSMHGCWDRHWWHYKIRDFPSLILQQGGYALHLAAGLELPGAPRSGFLRDLARASGHFWMQRATRGGAFEEYYPREQGYPPLAFSTLAMAKLVGDGVVDQESVRAGLEVAAAQLRARFEAQASNQQVAGTAALAMLRKLDADLVPEADLAGLIERTFALQHEEGWFPEYDGPDLGYLSVTLDCLWDLSDATGDSRCLAAIDRAVEFLAWFTEQAPHQAGMHNARNTDYLVPYGLVRVATGTSASAGTAAAVVRRVFATAAEPDHFLAAVDERYWCHYTGHSLMRAVKLLRDHPLAEDALPQAWPDGLAGSGHHRLRQGKLTVLVSGRKGGILTADFGGGRQASDFGWIINPGCCESLVSHWWSPDWEVAAEEDAVSVRGSLVPHRELVSTPMRHILLRLASRFLGHRLIGRLKRRLIFKQACASLRFEREIRLEAGEVRIRDSFRGLAPGDEVVRAPRASKRHVASADSFHPEDAGLPEGVEMTEEWQRDGAICTVETRLRPTPS